MQAPLKPSTPAETRIVAQEIVHFLEAIYHTAHFLKTLPSRLSKPQKVQHPKPLLTQRIVALLESLHTTASHLKTLYLFTASDFPTFALPTLLFGLSGALSGPILTTNPSPSVPATLSRIPLATLLIWTNLLVFNISNQRSPASILEDSVNKPTRPIPAGRILATTARRVNLALVPVLLVLAYHTNVHHATLLLLAMQWMYNDLRGCDESLFLRNALVALGYGLYSTIALCVLTGPAHGVSHMGWMWLALVTLVMLGTQHICDIKDAEGDRTRGRRSAPIVMGEGACRWSVAVGVVLCSVACPAFFRLGMAAYAATLGFGGLVAGRTLFLRHLAADRATWKLWAAWTCSLFVLPLVARGGAETHLSVLYEALAHYVCPGHDCAERLNVLAVSGVALAVKGSGVVRQLGMHGEGNSTAVPAINVEVVA